jgi:hypothetical protein
MKNVHVLPTDKPSRLVKIRDILFYTTIENIIPRGVYQNIYITSDEEIKEGEWCLNGYILRHPDMTNRYNGDVNPIKKLFKKGDLWKFTDGTRNYGSTCDKIILTTDQDLIADGVQAIDDDFLEWFVKNPSCESVEVERLDTFKKTNEVYVDEIAGGNYYEIIKQYKIIIPQEEPEEMLMSTCVIFTAQEEIKPEPNFYEKLKEYFETTPREKVLEDWNKSAEFDKVGPTVDEFIENSNKEIFKNLKTISSKDIDPEFVDIANDNFWELIDSSEKTIEEVANKLYPENWESIMDGQHDSNSYERNAFIAGYNKAKEQSKNKYSEEDLMEAYMEGGDDESMYKTFYQWFENFKKK